MIQKISQFALQKSAKVYNTALIVFLRLRKGFLRMYAVIEQGGKQEKVTEGDCLDIELTDIAPDAKTIEFDKVLMVSDGEKIQVGTPYVEGAKVVGSFKKSAAEAVVKGEKLYPTHFRRRKNSKTKIGHRQKYLQVTIDKIEV